MEIIRKQINLNDFVSRAPALVPYIKTEEQGEGHINEATNPNGSWGGIMCDYTDNDDTTANMFRKYYKLKEISRNGLKLKKIERRDGVFYVENFSEYVRGNEFVIKSRSMFENVGTGLYKQVEDDGERITEPYIKLVEPNEFVEYQNLGGRGMITDVENMIGIIEIPSQYEGSKVPEIMYLSALDAYIDWFEVNHGYKYVITPQSAYDSADAEDKAEYFGKLPVHVGKESPTYAKLTRSIELPSGLAMKVNYYKKIDAEPEDCCLREEWNARGGAQLWKYLVTKRGLYVDQIEKWKARIEEGKITVPAISVPILLTQVYDDNGVMSAVGEDLYSGNEAKTVYEYREIPSSSIPSYAMVLVETRDSVPQNPELNSPTYIKVGSKYYFLFPKLYIDEGPFMAVSKLDQLRTRERVYDDDGNVLPFVNLRSSGDGYVADMPYRINEVKNLGIDVNGKKTYGDYIDTIEDTETAVTFTYYIGGEYDASKGVNISLNKAIDECGSESKSFSVTVKANKQWALLSIAGDWITVPSIEQNEKQNAGTRSVTIRVEANNTLDVRSGSVTFGIVTKGYYEEVTYSIVQQPGINNHVINFNGTSNYIVYFGDLAGTTGGTFNSLTGLTNYFNVVCRNSAWYVKDKPSWFSVDPVRGEENISTRITVKCNQYDGPRREGEILLVAVGDPKVTRSLKVVQNENGTMRYVLKSEPSATTIDYGQTVSCHICMEVREGGAVTKLGESRWTYDVIGGDASLFRISRSGEYFQITNCNTTNKENTLVLKSYPKSAPEVAITTNVTARPKTAPKVVDVYLYTTGNVVEYGKSLEMGVYMSPRNGNTVNTSDWDYTCDPPYSTVKNYAGIYTDKTAHTITIKNGNGSEQDQSFSIYAYYGPDNTCRSTAITITLKAAEKYNFIQGTLYLDESYKAFACVQIWPYNKDGNTSSVYASSSNWPGATFQGGWSGLAPIHAPNNRYKIMVFNGVYGNVNQFKVTLKRHDGTVGWYGYMRYNVEDWFNISEFEYNGGIYIDAYIESA